MVRRSSATSRGTSYWFQYFLFSCVPSISFVNAQVFRTRALTITKGKMKSTIGDNFFEISSNARTFTEKRPASKQAMKEE